MLYGFPGYMSNDSVNQLLEARSAQFTNPHPPIMAAEWRVLDAMLSGPLLMLVIQGAMFLHGCAALLRRVLSPRAAAVIASAILLFPPVLTTMAVIWKDSQMASYLVAGTALLLCERRRTRLIGLVLITAGCAFRYNAFAAAVPLVFALFEWRPGQRWFVRYPLSLLASVAVMAGATGVNVALTVESYPLAPSYADIVGVIVYSPPLGDDELREILRDTPLHATGDLQARARSVFSPRNAFSITYGEGRMFDIAATDAQRDALRRAWKTLVFGSWRAYLGYRIAVFCELIGLTDEEPWGAVYNGFVEMPEQIEYIQHGTTWSRAQHYLSEVYIWLAIDTPMFRPYIYIVVALLLLVLCCRDRVSFALLGSGLTYELSFFPAAGTPDFRYSQWMITCTCLAAVWIFVHRWRRGGVISA